MNTSIAFQFKINQLLTDENIVDKLVRHAAKVAFYNFEYSLIVLILFHDSFVSSLPTFLHIYGKPVVVQKNLYEQLDPQTRIVNLKHYILFVADVIDLSEKLQWLSINNFDNTGKHIIVCSSNEFNNNSCSEARVLETCWQYRITNVVYLKNDAQNGNVQLFTYYPYRNGKCGDSDPVKIDVIASRNVNLFPSKCSDLQLCLLIVSTFKQIPFMNFTESGKPLGVDGDILLLIGEALNATIKVVMPYDGRGWGWRDSNGTWTGSLRDIYYGNANVSMTSAAVTFLRYNTFEMSLVYKFLDIVWVTCPSELKPLWQKLLRPFGVSMNLTLGAIFLFIILLNVSLKLKIWSNFVCKTSLDSNSNLAFYAWMSFMGLPLKALPKHTILLVVIFLWLCFSFVLRSIYQGFLISALKDNSYYSHFKSLGDVIDAKYTLGGVPSLKEYYVNDSIIFDNWININPADVPNTFLKLSEGWKFLYATTRELPHEFLKQYNGKRRLQILPQKIVTTPSVLFFKKYSPLVHSVNKVILKLTEAGFVQKHYKDNVGKNIVYEVKSEGPIRLSEYTGCYVILVLGVIMSTLSFLLEIYFGYFY